MKEFFGRVNSRTASISIAPMKSPGGWKQSGQTREFAEYMAVCPPAFSPETVHRDE